jgi:hypothetical protein
MQSNPLTPSAFTLRPVSGIQSDLPSPQHAIAGAGGGGRDNDDLVDGDFDALDRPLTAERRLLCMIVRQLTQELLMAVGLEAEGGGRRRALGHVRQVAMYVCHVAYSMPMEEVAQAFGRDRSTVGHACRMVEDRRDDAAYDRFVTIVERMASAVYLLTGRRP